MDNPRSDKPIWHSPVWLTAIVGVISAFLTVPDIIGSYLTKQQEIKLQKEKTEGFRLGNIESKQEQEFKIVNNTLAKQGTERVFVLRYLASTLDDTDAKKWAQGEVERLDSLASRQEELGKARIEFAAKEKDLLERINKGVENTSELKNELVNLKTELAKKDSVVTEIQKNAGISKDVGRTLFSVIKIKRNTKYLGDAEKIWMDMGGWGFSCKFDGDYCEKYIRKKMPSQFSITNREGGDSESKYDVSLFKKVVIKKLMIVPTIFSRGGVIPLEIVYQCKRSGDRIDCIQNTTNEWPNRVAEGL